MGFNNPNEKKNGEFRFINDYLNKKYDANKQIGYLKHAYLMSFYFLQSFKGSLANCII